MLRSAIVILGSLFFIAAAWYWWFLHFNLSRALRVVHWVEEAVAKQGQVSGVEWTNPSRFRARLRLSGCAFREPSLDVRLAPRHIPHKWAMWRWRRQPETMTFEANLTAPPQLNVEIGRTRCATLNQRRMQDVGNWPTHTVATLYISNQPEWAPEISGRMTGVVSARGLDFLEVSFRPRPPQFSATFSLQETLRHPSGELAILDCLRELAEGSPTSRM